MATPEPWATVEYQAPNAAWASAVLELRARVEALEAATNDRQPAAKAPPADGLVQRVATVIGHGPEDAINWKPEARAAIREVIAYLQENYTDTDWVTAAAVASAMADLKEEAT